MFNSDHLIQELDKGGAFAGFQYVETTFPATPNIDHTIPHSLKPGDAENVDYQMVGADAACQLYHDQSPTRVAWGRGYIILRCTVASPTVRLLLTVPRP